MQVQADVDQSDIGRVATGQTARFTVDAYPEETFVGDDLADPPERDRRTRTSSPTR